MTKAYFYDEFKQIGTDYGSVDEVAIFDERMAATRDLKHENELILTELSLKEDSKMLEIGCGTGRLARLAARQCAQVTAADISETMLAYARQKASEEQLTNIDFTKGGFLHNDFADGAFDAVYSGLALHHLPDIWKIAALERLHRCLKPNCRFVLLDVCFDWTREEGCESYYDRILTEVDASKRNLASHIACEYSTTSELMKRIFEIAGYQVINQQKLSSFTTLFTAVRR